MTPKNIIQDAIQVSRKEDRTVSLEWTPELEDELLALCEDSADSSTVCEYWGDDWRVHLTMNAAEGPNGGMVR